MLQNMKQTFTPAPAILQRAQVGTQMEKGKIANIVVAVLVGWLAIVSQYIVILPVIMIQVIQAVAQNGPEAKVNVNMTDPSLMPLMLGSFIMPIISLLLYVKFTEKRNVRSMGFVKEKAVPDYLLGMVIAFVMFSACVGICLATGAMTFDGYVLNGQYGMLALLFAGFLVQGMGEEVVCRGFLLTSVGSKSGALIGTLVNSLLFGALHLGNSGVTFFSVANIVLFGVLMSLVVLKTNSIWMAGAIHSVWNFVQGNFYGILVSGNDAGPSVFRCTSVGGMEWLNGGSFGMEGGAATTLVQIVVIAVILFMKPRKAD